MPELRGREDWMERVTELISQRARETESEGGSEGGSERSGGGNEKGSKSFGQIRNGLFPTNRDTYIYKNLDAENSGLCRFQKWRKLCDGSVPSLQFALDSEIFCHAANLGIKLSRCRCPAAII